ncbi:hypothetical protein P872_10230 [Rhodonellum psychrophilum GCM71 = DSM 17998]|uniref:Uncharacterized protein n=1 Tax=Rhodonellum psychrophilum GCM71 = DSM 17998 TaxID=1123057 RepID=U5BUE0_9BACT|nr:hypothetical protein P872_10230 [Rhodonellum psychrophilum GCM71 = DSM 17998]
MEVKAVNFNFFHSAKSTTWEDRLHFHNRSRSKLNIAFYNKNQFYGILFIGKPDED